jgi:hypothetical protein
MATKTRRTISQFKSKLKGGGARPNLFEVVFTNANVKAMTGSGAKTDDFDAGEFSFLCKAASLPASNIAAIDVPFRGRIFKVAGDRTVDTWTVTVINDEDFKIRSAFEEWMQLIAHLDGNDGATSPAAYMSSGSVFQLGRGDTIHSKDSKGPNTEQWSLKEYKFIDMFPTNISAIDLSYDSGDTIEEFTIEFAVNNFERVD